MAQTNGGPVPRQERPLESEETPLLRFAGDLRRLRRRAGLPSYRALGKRANYSAAALSEALSGRRLPSLAVTTAIVRACDGDAGVWTERWRQLAAAQPGAAGDVATPYVGLAPYQADDADRFFGREALTDTLLTLVGERPFVGIFGSSGAGKSSLLRAGLVARSARTRDRADTRRRSDHRAGRARGQPRRRARRPGPRRPRRRPAGPARLAGEGLRRPAAGGRPVRGGVHALRRGRAALADPGADHGGRAAQPGGDQRPRRLLRPLRASPGAGRRPAPGAGAGRPDVDRGAAIGDHRTGRLGRRHDRDGAGGPAHLGRRRAALRAAAGVAHARRDLATAARRGSHADRLRGRRRHRTRSRAYRRAHLRPALRGRPPRGAAAVRCAWWLPATAPRTPSGGYGAPTWTSRTPCSTGSPPPASSRIDRDSVDPDPRGAPARLAPAGRLDRPRPRRPAHPAPAHRGHRPLGGAQAATRTPSTGAPASNRPPGSAIGSTRASGRSSTPASPPNVPAPARPSAPPAGCAGSPPG